MDDLLVRDLARAPEQQLGWLVGDAILLRSLAIPLGLLGGILADSLAQSGGLYVCLGLYGVGHAYLMLLGAVLRARGWMHAQSVLLSAHMTTIAVVSIVGCLLTHSVVLVAAVYAAATAAAVAIGYALLLRKGVHPRYAWRQRVWKSQARASLAF